MNDKALNIKIPENLHQSLTELARRKNISMSALVRIILTEYLEKNTPQNPLNDGFAQALMMDSLVRNNKK